MSSGKQWHCPMCTFVNKDLKLACEMCGTTRPEDKGGSGGAGGSSSDPKELPGAVPATIAARFAASKAPPPRRVELDSWIRSMSEHPLVAAEVVSWSTEAASLSLKDRSDERGPLLFTVQLPQSDEDPFSVNVVGNAGFEKELNEFAFSSLSYGGAGSGSGGVTSPKAGGAGAGAGSGTKRKEPEPETAPAATDRPKSLLSFLTTGSAKKPEEPPAKKAAVGSGSQPVPVARASSTASSGSGSGSAAGLARVTSTYVAPKVMTLTHVLERALELYLALPPKRAKRSTTSSGDALAGVAAPGGPAAASGGAGAGSGSGSPAATPKKEAASGGSEGKRAKDDFGSMSLGGTTLGRQGSEGGWSDDGGGGWKEEGGEDDWGKDDDGSDWSVREFALRLCCFFRFQMFVLRACRI